MDFLTTKEPGALEELFRGFLRKRERVLLCFPGKDSEMGGVFAEMVKSCGAIPVFWGEDLRWKTLLRKGFSERCGTIIGAPEIILGLSKLAKRMGTPLYIRSAVLVGKVPDEWMAETIQKGLDCKIRACCCIREEHIQDPAMLTLSRELRRWTTILDFRLEKQGPGLSLEMVTFPGEKLPKLPSFARLVVREWDPERDCPFDIPLQWKNMAFSAQNH